MKRIRVIIMSVCMICCLGWSLNSSMAAQYDPLVEKVQRRLTELGYDLGPIDGKIGPKTVKAIKKFQQEQGVAVTGKLDEDTLQKLYVLDNKRPSEGATETQKGSGTSEPQEQEKATKQTTPSESFPGITSSLTIEGVEFRIFSKSIG